MAKSSSFNIATLLSNNWLPGLRSRIARKFVLLTVLSSTLLAIISTSIQLYSEYTYDIGVLKNIADSVEETRIPSLIESVWLYDEVQIERQLLGVLHQNAVEQVEILKDGLSLYSVGKIQSESTLNFVYPLKRMQNQQEFNLGELHLTIGLDELYSTLIGKAILVFVSNGIKTALVTVAILILYQRIIGRYITQIAVFAHEYDPANPPSSFSLNRPSEKDDELEELQAAINSWIKAQHDHDKLLLQKNKDLALSNKQLEDVNYELSRFTYSASHDLKAPLATMMGMLKFSQSDIQQGNTDKALVTISHAKTLSERLKTRIEDMLELAKSDLDDEIEVEANIENIVESAWTRMVELYPDVNANLTTTFEYHTPPKISETRLNIIFENLISNALKYSDPSRNPAEVDVTIKSDNERLIISVSDNGIGIPSQYHGKVFGMFQRFANTKQQGSGLGLAIVKKNVEKLGGEINFASSPKGTSFKISLPV